MTGYFITGTDTDAGKTFVACALARRAVACGHRVFAFKPIETGCQRSADGTYRGEDQEALAIAAGDWQTGAFRGLYRYALPAAPLVAAVQAESSIDLDLIARTARDGAKAGAATLTIVEGAGGWRVPITPQADMATLAGRLGWPVVVVARAGLGTINHSLLTLEAIERDGCQIAALVLSQRPSDDPAAASSNRSEIGRCWQGSILILGSDQSVLDGLLA